MICVAGPPARGSYLDGAANEKAFRDGWFRTGERGHLDAEGHLHITGRSRDAFISGGFDVHPRETGELLPTHPTPSAVAVPCVPHPCRGEVGLVVCACQPERGVSEDGLGERVSDRLAKYEVPQRFVFPDEMLETVTAGSPSGRFGTSSRFGA